MKFFATLVLFFMPLCAFAQVQDPLEDPEQAKKIYENIETTVDKYTESLKLDDAQVFRVDSILTHDYIAMIKELTELNKARVSNPDIFLAVQDKWQEQMYNSYRRIFSDEQWNKWLKMGGSREKKARDKRAAKRQK